MNAADRGRPAAWVPRVRGCSRVKLNVRVNTIHPGLRGTQVFVGGQIGWNAQQQFESDDFIAQTAPLANFNDSFWSNRADVCSLPCCRLRGCADQRR